MTSWCDDDDDDDVTAVVMMMVGDWWSGCGCCGYHTYKYGGHGEPRRHNWWDSSSKPTFCCVTHSIQSIYIYIFIAYILLVVAVPDILIVQIHIYIYIHSLLSFRYTTPQLVDHSIERGVIVVLYDAPRTYDRNVVPRTGSGTTTPSGTHSAVTATITTIRTVLRQLTQNVYVR